MTEITATYSPEDNKLRLYATSRLDTETYARVKAAGFKWAPKQELFVAPCWSPAREDLCLALAGDIEPEQTTLLERAEAKAERLDALAVKRAGESNSFYDAAQRLSRRFEGGQPILVGHHSERKARKDQQRMHNAMDKSVQADKAAMYWGVRAEGVEKHANRKNNPGVRARRIETLLKDLRSFQRDFDHANFCLILLGRIVDQKGSENFADQVRYWVGQHLKSGRVAPRHTYDLLDKGEISPDEALCQCIEYHEKEAQNPVRLRWIEHTLNRLGYERAELGPVPRFEGELTATVLQAFARENGVCSPKAVATETGFLLKTQSKVPLPLHIGDGNSLELTTDEWRDFLQGCGYTVPEKKPGKPPILNFKAQALTSRVGGRLNEYPQKEMTKAEYAKVWSDYKGVRPSACGQFRFRIVMIQHALYAVYLTDSKAHPAPESEAVTFGSAEGVE